MQPKLKLVDPANRVYETVLPDKRIVTVGKKWHTFNAVNMRTSTITLRRTVRWAWAVINEATGQTSMAEGFDTRADALDAALAFTRANPVELVLTETG